ncbi:MAG: regulatory protein NosR [Acetobacteraceae bacterium]|nr:regulatory protein NosR [Acetobacteraceae bacterium]
MSSRVACAPALWACGRGVVQALVMLCVLATGPGLARPLQPTPAELAELFPGADMLAPAPADDTAARPPVLVARRGGEVLGYVFSSAAAVGSTGFSGRPVDVWVGLRKDGVIAGALLAEHHEPILGAGIAESRLHAFLAGYRGRDIHAAGAVPLGEGAARARGFDAISGATISSAVLDDAILRTARKVARAYGIIADPAAGTIDLESSTPRSWTELLAEGSIARLRLTAGDLARSAPDMERPADPDSLVIDLFVAPIAPARIGRNLLGDRDYAALMAGLAPGEQPILIAASGLVSFKGTRFVRTGVFDRVRLVQGEHSMELTAPRHRRLARLQASGAPDFAEIGLFTLPATPGLDLARPWQLALMISRPSREGGVAHAGFELEYRLPALYRPSPPVTVPTVPTLLDILAPDPPSGERPLWQLTWRAAPGRIAVLTAALAILGALLVVQDWLVRSRTRHLLVRFGFLAFTLGWLGWYIGAQLSVVNVLTFVNAVLTGFRWEFFLVDPMAFILWSAVAVALLFLGRGVFCGWLCPFGALQEFANAVSRRAGIVQLRVPFLLHERLWPLKYIIFLGLLALSLQSLEGALPWTEVEPFKAAILLRVERRPGALTWVLLYLAVLFVAALFVERAFCRYLCPLGAALAIPARMRMFEWLRRRAACGTQCQICARNCPVQAIHPDGHINPNECIHCLGCQVNYYDDRTCPPLMERRRRRAARREAVAESSAGDPR